MQAARQARRRRRRGVGRRAAPRAGRRHPAGQDHVFRRRQDGARDGFRARRRHPLLQRRIRARAGTAVGARRRRRQDVAPVSLRINPDVDARTHRKISTGKAENKFGIPWQRARARLCPRGRAARHPASPASTSISAARSPSCSRSTTPSRCWPNWSARCAPTATRSSMSISAAGSAFPTAPTTSRRRCPTPMRRSSRSTSRRLGLKVIFEPGRLIVGNAGILVSRGDLREGRRRQEFPRRRRGDERPDPPDALRRLPRHPAGRRSRRPTRRA